MSPSIHCLEGNRHTKRRLVLPDWTSEWSSRLDQLDVSQGKAHIPISDLFRQALPDFGESGCRPDIK